MQDKLILLGLGNLNLNTGGHEDPSNDLLSNEVSDLNLPLVVVLVLLQVDVDGEMGVYVTHFVLEALCDTNDQVVDQGSDSSEGSDILALAVVDLDGNGVLLGEGEVNSQVAEILDKLAYRFHPVRIFPIPTIFKRECGAVEIEDLCFSEFWEGKEIRTSGTFDGDDSGLDRDLD